MSYLGGRIDRGTQQTVSVNICLADLLSPAIFKLKCDGKLEYSLVQILRDMEKVMPVVSGEIKMSFCGVRIKGQLAFSERQQQLVNSGNKISLPRFFLSLKVQLAYPIHSS